MLNKKILLIVFLIQLTGFIPKPVLAVSSDLVFSEIMYDLSGSDENREWVEVYNKGTEPVIVATGSGTETWRFNDGSNHLLSLFQGSETIEPQGFAIIADDGTIFLNDHLGFSGTIFDTSMNLSNEADTLSLSADGGQSFFSEISYNSNWGAAGNNKTLEKINLSGGEEQNNWQESFIEGGTPGLASSLPPPNQPPVAEAGENQSVTFDQEVFFDGSASSDPENDFLTYNWNFGDNDFGFGATTSHSYLATGTFTVVLTVSDGELEDQDNLIVLVNEPIINHAPVALAGADKNGLVNQTFVFDGSASTDPDGDPLTYFWDFGSGNNAFGVSISHSFQTTGSHLVTLYVSDGQATSTDNLTVNIANPSPPPAPGQSSSGGGSGSLSQDYSQIFINEFLPNPAGDDEGEWIELYNNGQSVVNLTGLKIQDNSTSVFMITSQNYPNSVISAKGFFVVERSLSHISLNNTGGDCVKILSPANTLLKSVCYSSSAVENKSYARKEDNNWDWTTVLTKGAVNQFAVTVPDQEPIITNNSTGTIETVFNNEEIGENIYNEEIFNDDLSFIYDVSEAKQLPKGQKIAVRGMVTALPGMIAKNFFYIAEYKSSDDYNLSEGLQIYSSKKDFPVLAVGEVIQIDGELSESQGEKRLKIKKAADITILEKLKLPAIDEINTAELSEEMVSGFIKVTGAVIDKQSGLLVLSDDSGEIKIYLNKEINSQLTEAKNQGWPMMIAGILRKYKDGLRLVPRAVDDYSFGTIVSDIKLIDSAKAAGSETIKVETDKSQPGKYLIIVLIILALVSVGLIIKVKYKKR